MCSSDLLGMGYGHVDSIAKLVPAPPGKQVTLARVPKNPDPSLIYARKEAPEIEQREAAEEEVAELLSLAARVEGITRNIGMHAGGVLIAPGKITSSLPCLRAQKLGMFSIGPGRNIAFSAIRSSMPVGRASFSMRCMPALSNWNTDSVRPSEKSL